MFAYLLSKIAKPMDMYSAKREMSMKYSVHDCEAKNNLPLNITMSSFAN